MNNDAGRYSYRDFETHSQMANMGGRTGGWDHRDHDTFIKVWTQIGCCPIPCERGYEGNTNRDEEQAQDDMHFEGDDADVDEVKMASQRERRDASPNKSSSVMVLPRNQDATLLRKLLTQVPGKNEKELADHTEWYESCRNVFNYCNCSIAQQTYLQVLTVSFSICGKKETSF